MPHTRHGRFLIAFVIGSIVGLATSLTTMSWGIRVLSAANVFFISYLFLMFQLARAMSPDDLRAHAKLSDEGLPLIAFLAAGAVATSMSAIFFMLASPGMGAVPAILALASVPLGWAMVHTLAGFHYAYMFYTADKAGRDNQGLAFPASDEPGPWEFLYYAFVVGMTAQVSDVAVQRTDMRITTLVHSVASFFYNTVILALAVNAALSLGH